MQNSNSLQNQTDFLLFAALRRCGDIETARDLTQEALLAALSYQKKGGWIKDIRGWLLTVMNRKYYDLLRKKYRLPTVTVNDGFEPANEDDGSESVIHADEAEAVRREVAYLSGLYRTITARYYFRGESVEKIAADLGMLFVFEAIARGLHKRDLGYPCPETFVVID